MMVAVPLRPRMAQQALRLFCCLTLIAAITAQIVNPATITPTEGVGATGATSTTPAGVGGPGAATDGSTAVPAAGSTPVPAVGSGVPIPAAGGAIVPAVPATPAAPVAPPPPVGCAATGCPACQTCGADGKCAPTPAVPCLIPFGPLLPTLWGTCSLDGICMSDSCKSLPEGAGCLLRNNTDAGPGNAQGGSNGKGLCRLTPTPVDVVVGGNTIKGQARYCTCDNNAAKPDGPDCPAGCACNAQSIRCENTAGQMCSWQASPVPTCTTCPPCQACQPNGSCGPTPAVACRMPIGAMSLWGTCTVDGMCQADACKDMPDTAGCELKFNSPDAAGASSTGSAGTGVCSTKLADVAIGAGVPTKANARFCACGSCPAGCSCNAEGFACVNSAGQQCGWQTSPKPTCTSCPPCQACQPDGSCGPTPAVPCFLPQPSGRTLWGTCGSDGVCMADSCKSESEAAVCQLKNNSPNAAGSAATGSLGSGTCSTRLTDITIGSNTTKGNARVCVCSAASSTCPGGCTCNAEQTACVDAAGQLCISTPSPSPAVPSPVVSSPTPTCTSCPACQACQPDGSCGPTPAVPCFLPQPSGRTLWGTCGSDGVCMADSCKGESEAAVCQLKNNSPNAAGSAATGSLGSGTCATRLTDITIGSNTTKGNARVCACSAAANTCPSGCSCNAEQTACVDLMGQLCVSVPSPSPAVPSPAVPSPEVPSPSPAVPSPAVPSPSPAVPSPDVPSPAVPSPEVASPSPAVPSPAVPSPEVLSPSPAVPSPVVASPAPTCSKCPPCQACQPDGSCGATPAVGCTITISPGVELWGTCGTDGLCNADSCKDAAEASSCQLRSNAVGAAGYTNGGSAGNGTCQTRNSSITIGSAAGSGQARVCKCSDCPPGCACNMNNIACENSAGVACSWQSSPIPPVQPSPSPSAPSPAVPSPSPVLPPSPSPTLLAEDNDRPSEGNVGMSPVPAGVTLPPPPPPLARAIDLGKALDKPALMAGLTVWDIASANLNASATQAVERQVEEFLRDEGSSLNIYDDSVETGNCLLYGYDGMQMTTLSGKTCEECKDSCGTDTDIAKDSRGKFLFMGTYNCSAGAPFDQSTTPPTPYLCLCYGFKYVWTNSNIPQTRSNAYLGIRWLGESHATCPTKCDVCDDPHLKGFDGSDFDFMGTPGEVFSLYSDASHQINMLLDDFGINDVTFMKDIGFMYGPDVRIAIRAQEAGGFSVTINNRTLNENANLNMKLGAAADVVFHQVLSPEYKAVTISTPTLRFSVMKQGGQALHLNAQVNFIGAPPPATTVHGVLGQTLRWIDAEQPEFEGEEEDYIVQPETDTLGFPTKFNMFKGERAMTRMLGKGSEHESLQEHAQPFKSAETGAVDVDEDEVLSQAHKETQGVQRAPSSRPKVHHNAPATHGNKKSKQSVEDETLPLSGEKGGTVHIDAARKQRKKGRKKDRRRDVRLQELIDDQEEGDDEGNNEDGEQEPWIETDAMGFQQQGPAAAAVAAEADWGSGDAQKRKLVEVQMTPWEDAVTQRAKYGVRPWNVHVPEGSIGGRWYNYHQAVPRW